MKAASFIELLEDDQKLKNVSLDELEALKNLYPYAASIRLLYIKKLKLENVEIPGFEHQILNKMLPDKRVLFRINQPIAPPSRAEKDLKILIDQLPSMQQGDEKENQPTQPNSEFEEELNKPKEDELALIMEKENQDKTEPTAENKVKAAPNDGLHLGEDPKKKSKEKRKKKSKKKKERLKSEKLKQKKKIKNKKEKKQKKSKISKEIKLNKPAKKKEKAKRKKEKSIAIQKSNTFIDWLEQLKAVKSIESKEQNIVKKASKKKKKSKKKKDLQRKINSSQFRNKAIASETLAKLMVKQGNKNEAIDIYKALMHKNPQKSRYFAAEIKKLK